MRSHVVAGRGIDRHDGADAFEDHGAAIDAPAGRAVSIKAARIVDEVAPEARPIGGAQLLRRPIPFRGFIGIHSTLPIQRSKASTSAFA